jgi:hypothetical protein
MQGFRGGTARSKRVDTIPIMPETFIERVRETYPFQKRWAPICTAASLSRKLPAHTIQSKSAVQSTGKVPTASDAVISGSSDSFMVVSSGVLMYPIIGERAWTPHDANVKSP